MKLVIDDKIPYIRGEAERLGEAVYLPGAAITAADVREADALIVRTRTRCDESLLRGSRVRFIATATIGYDHLDTGYLDAHGIGWANCPGCNARSVAQYVGCALLLLRESLPQLNRPGCTVGIVGVGHVGRAVAHALRQLGFRLLLCDPPRAEQEGPEGFVSLEAIEREADVITFHTPLTRTGRHATYHMADTAFFARLRKRPVFINAARGEVVATEALTAAIEAGQVGPAVIDTWEGEPHICRALLEKAWLATPHIAGYSADGKAAGTRMALQATARYFGLPATFHVTPPAWPAGYRGYAGSSPFPATCTQTAADHFGCLSLAEKWLFAYDPRVDSQVLKADPAAFERLRGDYPLRREPWNI